MAGGGACGRDDMSEDESDVELDGPEGLPERGSEQKLSDYWK